jgi:hypothetical protein
MSRKIIAAACLVLLACGCASRPPMVSLDGKANYGYVFAGMEAAEPVVVNSRVEREKKSVLGIIPLKSEYTGLWEFELLASRAWVEEVKRGVASPYGAIPYSEIAFADVPKRDVPAWFVPTAENFSAWNLQGKLSNPHGHLFIEKEPVSGEKIRVFVRRY